MVAFRNEIKKTVVRNWWDNGNNQIAFGLGNKGFIAFNTEGTAMNLTLQVSYLELFKRQMMIKQDNTITLACRIK